MNVSSIKNTLTYCLILTPIIVFWYVFEKYAVNIPHWDDFAVRNSLLSFLNSPTTLEKLKILFAQHNEHRIFLTRLSAFLIDAIKGTLDVKWLMFIGNFSLVGILFLFHKITEKYKFSLLALVPISFLIFNVGLFENTFWGMACIQNFGVLFLAFLTFYWLVFSAKIQTKNYLYFAIFTCFLGIFTSSNGILIPMIGLLILLFQQRKQAFFVWITSSIAFLFAYFYGFENNPEKASKANLSDITLLFKGFFATVGNAIDSSFVFPDQHTNLSMAVGILMVLFMSVFGYQTIFKKYNDTYRQNDLFLLACLAFLGITCVGIVYARISFGFGILLTSKYKIYAVLMLCICYLIALKYSPKDYRNRFVQLSILSTISFNIYTYIADYQAIRYLRQERFTDQFKQQYSDKDIAITGILGRLQQPEKAFYDGIIEKITQPTDSVKTSIIITQNETSFRLEENQNADIIDLTSPDAGQYFILKSAEKVYLFPTQAIPINRKAYLNPRFLVNNRLPIGNFATEISKFYIQSGNYQLGKVLVENNTKTVTFTSQSIDIQAVTKEKPQQNW